MGCKIYTGQERVAEKHLPGAAFQCLEISKYKMISQCIKNQSIKFTSPLDMQTCPTNLIWDKT